MTLNVYKRRSLWLGVGVAAVASGAYWHWHTRSTSSPGSDDGTILFALQWPDIKGQAQPLSTWQGRVLVVNFWATWCPPCVEEMPDFQRLRDQYQDRGVEVLGLAVDNAAAVTAFAARLGIRYPLLVAGAAGIALSQRLGNTQGGLPFTVILAPSGQVQYRHSGRLEAQNLQQMIESTLKMSPK